MKHILFFVMIVLLLSPFACKTKDRAVVAEYETVKGFLAATKTTVKEVRDLGSLYELTLEQGGTKGIVYVSKDGKYVIVGELLDKDIKSLTKERMDELNKVSLSDLPLKEAVISAKGSGAKKLVLVTDVDCAFCRNAYQWLHGKTDYTLYTFLFPLDIHPQARGKSVRILCSKDPVAALGVAKSGGEVGADECEQGRSALDRHMSVGRDLGVTGTPLFITGEGRRIEGFDQAALDEYLLK